LEGPALLLPPPRSYLVWRKAPEEPTKQNGGERRARGLSEAGAQEQKGAAVVENDTQ
jgi:hypothetical protein